MNSPLSPAAARQPLYLFADSQLLFWKPQGKLLLEGAIADRTVNRTVDHRTANPTNQQPAAAYIGASNGDRKEFYSIFEAAMEAIGITERRMILSTFDAEDRAFLARAQLILLAGGDVHLGWSTFEKTGMKEQILERYAQGATLIGISAGAVQLGQRTVVSTEESAALELIDVFNLVPALIDVHDEQHEWARLSRTIHMLEGSVTGLGIPTGGGILAHPDGTLEALRRPVDEFSWDGTRIKQSILLPTGRE
jgi:cyanophycinase-like exopeptidase